MTEKIIILEKKSPKYSVLFLYPVENPLPPMPGMALTPTTVNGELIPALRVLDEATILKLDDGTLAYEILQYRPFEVDNTETLDYFYQRRMREFNLSHLLPAEEVAPTKPAIPQELKLSGLEIQQSLEEGELLKAEVTKLQKAQADIVEQAEKQGKHLADIQAALAPLELAKAEAKSELKIWAQGHNLLERGL